MDGGERAIWSNWRQETGRPYQPYRRQARMQHGNKSKKKKDNEVVYGPEPPPKYLTTKGLILRGIVFCVAIAGICYLLWQEFGGK
jgi:hypothetical protein